MDYDMFVVSMERLWWFANCDTKNGNDNWAIEVQLASIRFGWNALKKVN